MLDRTYKWQRPNEEVAFKKFSKEDIDKLTPLMEHTDQLLQSNKRLNATFVKKQPVLLNDRVAAETRYKRFGNGAAKVYVSPIVFEQNRFQWNPSGVVAHEIGHLVGPTRGTNSRERQEFKKAFSYRQKKVWHDYAPDEWTKRRDNPLRNSNTRQSISPGEDFAETFRAFAGEPFTNRTNQKYFNVVMTPQRVNYMKRRVVN